MNVHKLMENIAADILRPVTVPCLHKEVNSHVWACLDTPGYFSCKCGAVSRHNRVTGSKEIIVYS